MWFGFLVLMESGLGALISIQQEINVFYASYIAIDLCFEVKPFRPLQKPILTEQNILDILNR